MSLPAPDKKKFTYGDYLTWPEEERWELIDGQPYDMTPAPSTFHQSISMEFSIQIGSFLADKACRFQIICRSDNGHPPQQSLRGRRS